MATRKKGKQRKPTSKKPASKKPLLDKLTVQQHARERMSYALSFMGAGAEEYGSAQSTVFTNKDGSIDGECRINDISHGISIEEFLIHLEQFAKPVITGSHLFHVKRGDTTSWASIALIRPVRERTGRKKDTGLIEDKDDEFYMASRVDSNWRKALRLNIIERFLWARTVNENFKRKKRLRVYMIIYKLHFNPRGIQPERDSR